MARDPGSLWSPLPEAGDPDGYVKNKLIVHSTGSRASARSIFDYFAGPTGNESTFIIGLGPDDPTRQLLDSNARADANLAANKSGISVEVVGTGDDPYTAWQIGELIRLGRWACETHRIPCQVIPDPDGAGFGWHIMFGAPGPWTSVVKVCPGDQRIAALRSIVFPAIFAPAPKPIPEPAPLEDVDMLLIRNSQGTVHLLSETFSEWVPTDADNLALQSKLGKPITLSDGLFDRLTKAARTAGA